MELSIEMKKILLIALPRISMTEIRIVTDRENYLSVLEELRQLQSSLEKDVNEAGQPPEIATNGL